jgi:hypothetical protein
LILVVGKTFSAGKTLPKELEDKIGANTIIVQGND